MAEKTPSTEKKKKNIFTKVWKRLGRRGRIAVTSVAYLGMFAIPMTVPLQLGCLAVIMNESKTAQKLIAKARKRWPDKTEKMIGKTVKSKFCPGILKDLFKKTDPKVFFENEKKEKEAKAAAKAAKKSEKKNTKQKHPALLRILVNKNKYMANKKAEGTVAGAVQPTVANNAALNAVKDGGR